MPSSEVSDGPLPAPAAPKAAVSGPGPNQEQQNLLEALRRSKIYQEYSQVFSHMTGLKLELVETNEAPRSTGLEESPTLPQHHFAPGLTRVPVQIKSRLAGYLQTGLMISEKPTEEQFDQFYRQAAGNGNTPDRDALHRAYFTAAVLPLNTQESAQKLMGILAQHLGMLGGEGEIQPRRVEPATISRAKAYIHEHLTDKLYLAEVAKVVNLNTFYFCKFFRKITGQSFTDYVSQLRIEKAKALLQRGGVSVTEVAYASGFNSLTHFNRIFKKLTGVSPSIFRARQPKVQSM